MGLSLISIVVATAQTPANDAFSQAAPLTGASGVAIASNDEATAQQDEPKHAENPAQASVWWRWTAPADGLVAFDTLLGVFTGDSLDSLVLVADNDDFDEDYSSRVSFAAARGTTYHIVVQGYEGEAGAYVLNWSWLEVPGEEIHLSAPTRLPDGSFQFRVDGPPGNSGHIQRSDAYLQNWQNWQPFTLDGTPRVIVDDSTDAGPARYYRAATP